MSDDDIAEGSHKSDFDSDSDEEESNENLLQKDGGVNLPEGGSSCGDLLADINDDKLR